jgi:hypothetical protein
MYIPGESRTAYIANAVAGTAKVDPISSFVLQKRTL